MRAYFKGYPIFGPRGPAGPDGNPVGTVISFMGKTAPKDYLVCDGAEYSISEHPTLAGFFREQFGSVNHFGGDGETTFAVPDLRNLFLRGYHGEAEEQLSGEIAEKQKASDISIVYGTSDDNLAYGANSFPDLTSYDTLTYVERMHYIYKSGSAGLKQVIKGTSRPVNMAVLYCIKAVESAPEAAVEDYDTADGWHVRKWPDGYVKMIYKGSNSFRVLYEAPYTYYVANTSISFPIVLVEKYSENLSLLDSSNTDNPKIPLVYTAGDNEKTNQWGVLITTKDTGATMNYSIVVTGRWK